MDQAVSVLLAILVAAGIAVAGWPVAVLVLKASSRRHLVKAGKLPSKPTVADGGLRGGLWIGLVERFACALAVMAGQVTLIAVVVAVKGLGRFKELSTPEASERFVLGTLVSLTWACLLGTIWALLSS